MLLGVGTARYVGNAGFQSNVVMRHSNNIVSTIALISVAEVWLADAAVSTSMMSGASINHFCVAGRDFEVRKLSQLRHAFRLHPAESALQRKNSFKVSVALILMIIVLFFTERYQESVVKKSCTYSNSRKLSELAGLLSLWTVSCQLHC